jgi:hypothetical protein
MTCMGKWISLRQAHACIIPRNAGMQKIIAVRVWNAMCDAGNIGNVLLYKRWVVVLQYYAT